MFNLLPLFSNELHPPYQHTEYYERVTLQSCRVFCNSYTNTERERLDLLGVGLTSMACRPYSTMFIQKQSFSISACFSLHSQTLEFHTFLQFLNKPNSERSHEKRDTVLQCAYFDYSKLTYKELTLCLFEFIIWKHVNAKHKCHVELVSSSVTTSTNIQ